MELETFTMAYLFKKKTWKDTDFLSTVIEETKKKCFIYFWLLLGRLLLGQEPLKTRNLKEKWNQRTESSYLIATPPYL